MRPFKPPSKYYSCSTKKNYITELGAKVQCKKVTWQALVPYECFYCGGWHVCKKENYNKYKK